jgi:predicted transcriptional regulator
LTLRLALLALLLLTDARPLHADGLSQQYPKLVASGAIGFASQGRSVSLSGDGDTAVVGAPDDSGGAGAAWIWTRVNGYWLQGPKLVGADAVGAAHQGTGVALSGDGTIAVVGGFGDNSDKGAVWIWHRVGDAWTQQGTKLVGSGAIDIGSHGAHQGAAVAISADGLTVLVGGPEDSGGIGASWVWTRSGDSWSQQGPKLRADGVIFPYEGWSVALSADGNTALIGAPGGIVQYGAYVWVRNNGVWTRQGERLSGSGGGGTARYSPNQGFAVALSADGNTAIVGGPADDYGHGAAWVWTRNGSVWTQQGPKLVGSGSIGGAQGSAVALSADGNVALVGGTTDNFDIYGAVGAVWEWRRNGAVWTQEGPKLVAGDVASLAKFGTSVSLSADGRTALVGGDHDQSVCDENSCGVYSIGAAWIFSANGGTPGDVDVKSDFDGDGRSDFAVYRPTTGEWFVRYSSLQYVVGAGPYRYEWGLPGDVPLVADFDGDRRTDLTVFRQATGEWFIRYSSLGYATGAGAWLFQWGLAGDKPVVADFDGDGKTDLAIYRPTTGEWYFRYSSRQFIVDAADFRAQWGLLGDTPVAADYDGDGRTDFAVYRPTTGEWFIRYSSKGFAVGAGDWWFQWGLPGDRPQLADFDGDNRIDLTVYRPSSGEWLVRYSTQGFEVGAGEWRFQWGLAGDTPVVADFDGDGRNELTVYRPRSGEWFIRYSRAQFVLDPNGWYVQWGIAGDTPLPSN